MALITFRLGLRFGNALLHVFLKKLQGKLLGSNDHFLLGAVICVDAFQEILMLTVFDAFPAIGSVAVFVMQQSIARNLQPRLVKLFGTRARKQQCQQFGILRRPGGSRRETRFVLVVVLVDRILFATPNTFAIVIGVIGVPELIRFEERRGTQKVALEFARKGWLDRLDLQRRAICL